MCSYLLQWILTIWLIILSKLAPENHYLGSVEMLFVSFRLCQFWWSFFFYLCHNGQWPPTLKDCYSRFYPLHYFLILICEKEPVFSLVWHGSWLGIEPGTSRTRCQHSTTRLSRRRYWGLNRQWPPTLKDCYPRFYPLLFCSILILEKKTVFLFLMFSAKQGNYLVPFL